MKKSYFSRVGLVVGVIGSLCLFKQSFAACVIYEHPGQQGFAAHIADNTKSNYLGNFMIQTRSWAGAWSGWSGTEINFNDAASSVDVSSGCQLTVWEHSEYGGRKDTYTPGKQGLKVDNAASSAFCNCNPGPILYMHQ